MPFSIRYNDAISAVETIFTGTVTAGELNAALRQGFVLANQQGSNRYLATMAEASIDISMTEVYEMPVSFEAMGGKRPIRVAIMPPADEASRVIIDFYKLVSLNRGWTVETFSKCELAREWLISLESPQPDKPDR